MEIEITWGLILGVIIGLVEVGKLLKLPKRFAPLLAIILGIGFGFLTPNLSAQSAILGGIVAGLSAVGLFSGVKNVVQGVKDVIQLLKK